MEFLSRGRHVLIGVAGVLVGLGMGLATRDHQPNRSGTSQIEERGGPDPGFDLQVEVRRAVAEELVRSRAYTGLGADERRAIAAEVVRALREDGAGAGPPKAAEAPRTDAPASSEAQAARREADLLIERARAAREWTDRDATALRLLMPALSGADNHAVTVALFESLRTGQLSLKTQGPPF